MRIEDFQNLLKANRILASTLDLDKLLQIVLELAADVVQAEAGSVLILDDKTGELTFNITLGSQGKELKTIRLKVGEGIAGWVAKENRALIVNDPKNDARWTRKADDKTKFVTRSILCVPMVHQGKLLGVVQAINKKDPKGFTSEEQTILEAFAAQVAVAIQNASLFSSLRQEKEKVEMILSKMTEGAILTDGNGTILVCNPSAQMLLGLEDRGGASPCFWNLLESFQLTPPLEPLLSSPLELSLFEAKRVKGKSLILAGAIKKIFTDKNELSGTLTVLRDVTAEKKEERLKRDFLSLISHKLKTPLVAITGYTPLLIEDEDWKNLNPFFKKAIEAIHNQAIQLKGLVEKLIHFSLIEAEELVLLKKPHSPKKIFEEILKHSERHYSGQGIAIRVDASSLETLPDILIDETKFKEAVLGLIENGIKFNKNNEKKILLKGEKDKTSVLFFIQDNGLGIPPEESEKIFQKFYQIEESFTGQVQGAGLGLPMVKKYIEAHGGSVKLESKIGEGSTFILKLPI